MPGFKAKGPILKRACPKWDKSASLIACGGLWQGHQQMDQIALAARSRFTQHGLELVAHRSYGDMAKAGDLCERVTHQQADSHVYLGRRETKEGAQSVIRKIDWLIWIRHQ